MALLPQVDENERPEICGPCGGACCRTRPGIEAPGRFLAAADPTAALAAALRSREWVLAEHVGLPWSGGVPPPDEERYRTFHYPRPATRAERDGGGAAAATASDCVFLTPTGCRLPFPERPRMCRSLEPSADGECVAAWGRREAALAWRPHQELVAEARALAAAR